MESQQLINFIQWVIVFQIVLILVFVFLTGTVTLVNKIKKKRFNGKVFQLESALIDHVTTQTELGESDFDFPLDVYTETVDKFDKSLKPGPWSKIKKQLIQEYVLPKARESVTSKNWVERYFAVQAFRLYFDTSDQDSVEKLIFDEVSVVSMEAAQVAIQQPSQKLINAVVSQFSEGEYLQQSSYADFFAKLYDDSKDISLFLWERLVYEHSPDAKSFCYRILTALPTVKSKNTLKKSKLSGAVEETMSKDMDSENVDLQITAIQCFVSYFPEDAGKVLKKKLETDTHWEVRAQAAKLIGGVKPKPRGVAQVLEKSLRDPESLVRLRAAETLSKLEAPGIKILKNQSSKKNDEAYKVSKTVLERLSLE